MYYAIVTETCILAILISVLVFGTSLLMSGLWIIEVVLGRHHHKVKFTHLLTIYYQLITDDLIVDALI